MIDILIKIHAVLIFLVIWGGIIWHIVETLEYNLSQRPYLWIIVLVEVILCGVFLFDRLLRFLFN